VLERIGIADLFADIIDARILGETPKPNPSAYRHIASPPDATAFFDDSLRNLKPAHELGMTTIWCRTGPQGQAEPLAARPAHVHYETDDLTQFLLNIRIAR